MAKIIEGLICRFKNGILAESQNIEIETELPESGMRVKVKIDHMTLQLVKEES